jgi:hypothetical protein
MAFPHPFGYTSIIARLMAFVKQIGTKKEPFLQFLMNCHFFYFLLYLKYLFYVFFQNYRKRKIF